MKRIIFFAFFLMISTGAFAADVPDGKSTKIDQDEIFLKFAALRIADGLGQDAAEFCEKFLQDGLAKRFSPKNIYKASRGEDSPVKPQEITQVWEKCVKNDEKSINQSQEAEELLFLPF